MNSTLGEVLTLPENDSRALDSTAVLRAASMLFCQQDLLLNETNEQKQYFDKFRPDQQTSFDSDDDSSAYTYDNSTSE